MTPEGITPLPWLQNEWRIEHLEDDESDLVIATCLDVDDNTSVGCECPTARANAAYIVLAANAYPDLNARCDRLAVDLAEMTAANEKLVEACKLCIGIGYGEGCAVQYRKDAQEKARAALRAAGVIT